MVIWREKNSLQEKKNIRAKLVPDFVLFMNFSFFPNFSNYLDFSLCLVIFYSFADIDRWLNLKNFDKKNFSEFFARTKTIFRDFS